jgi:hypothetical protein
MACDTNPAVWRGGCLVVGPTVRKFHIGYDPDASSHLPSCSFLPARQVFSIHFPHDVELQACFSRSWDSLSYPQHLFHFSPVLGEKTKEASLVMG